MLRAGKLTTSNQKLSKHDARCFLSRLISHRPPFLFLKKCLIILAAPQPSPVSKPFILPHGFDSLLEERIVAARGQSAGQLDVVVESPEVLDLKIEAE